jgi:hypothetical protein
MQNTSAPKAQALMQEAARNTQLAAGMARQKFPQPVDPALGEVRSLRKRPEELAAAISSLQKSLWPGPAKAK